VGHLGPQLDDGGTVQSVTQLRLSATFSEGIAPVDSLVARARTGDLGAFEQLADRHLPDAYRLAMSMVGPDDARDVAQEAMVAAWRQLPNLRDESRFDSWLRSIVMNRARNLLRTRRRHPTVALQAEHVALLLDEPIAQSDLKLAIDAAFANLSIDVRSVLVLHYLLDLPLRQVAEILGVREGTAKSRLHAGLKDLRRRMEDRSL
jgi:RNA polymerase sigma-70 factor (ECF subfamily)